MVKLYYISVMFKNENNRVVTLKSAADLSSFGFFQRNRFLGFYFINESINYLCKQMTNKLIKYL